MNEYDWAENMVSNNDLGNKPIETLSRVAKYYYENQYTKREVRNMLDDFMLKCDPSVSLTHWSNTLDRVANGCDKHKLIRIDHIDITKPELETIRSADGIQTKRLAFTLLCAAKYWDAVSDHNNHWVNTPDKDIMQMANISATIRRQSKMFADLRDAGMIKFSKRVDNLNVQVEFIESGDVAMQITDFRNLGYQYMRHYGGGYFECENCGLTVKHSGASTGRPQKYCPSCAAEIKIKQSVSSVMSHRFAIGNCKKN